MRFLKILTAIFAVLFAVILVDMWRYPYSKKADDIQAVAKKLEYIQPAFSFESKEYKGFVYEE